MTACVAQWRLPLMEFGLDVQHWPEENHMAANALPRLSMSQIDVSNFDDDFTTYRADDNRAVTNFNVESSFEPLTIQSLISAQKEETNCRQLVEYANAPHSFCFCSRLGILKRQARLEGA